MSMSLRLSALRAAVRTSLGEASSGPPSASISSLRPSSLASSCSSLSSYSFASSSFNNPPQEEKFQLAKMKLSTLLKTFQSSEIYSRSPLASPATFVTKSDGLHSVSSASFASQSPSLKVDYHLAHPIWDNVYIDAVEITHREPKDWTDKIAHYLIKLVRFNFDWMSGYSFGKVNATKILRRCIFLESVAGVPGNVAATARHLASLRKMESDHGWIHTLLEEAENERMHLLTFLEVKQVNNTLFRWAVMLSQGIFYNFYFLAYLIYPRFCHRVVGYLEEEAVRTYTSILKHVDDADLDVDWRIVKAPPRAQHYWKLGEQATFRDVLAVIRADESHHRDVNHKFAELNPNEANPFPPGH